MHRAAITEFHLIRHAPSDAAGRLTGRSDVAARLPEARVFTALRTALPGPDARIVSPALRCRQTAAALYPGAEFTTDPRLWEQDFGQWDGADAASVPDLGPLSGAALARHRPPGGESFEDLCARAAPAFTDFATGGAVVIVAHAGIVRAALGLALGSAAAALAFEVSPLSVTHLRRMGDGSWSVACVNRTIP